VNIMAKYDADGQTQDSAGDENPYEDISDVLVMLEASQDADSDMREKAREAHLFVSKRDGQWEPYWWNNNSGKPRYTFDMTSPIVDQICGELDRASFDIRVTPGGGDATKEVALTFDGIIRNIENLSQAKEVYAQASNGFVTCGIDGWRVVTKYVDEDSFDQDLVVEKVQNFVDRVWFDPASEKQDRSDSEWVVVLHSVSKREYMKRWPDGSCMSVGEGKEGEAYFDKAEHVVVGELLYREEYERELVLMSNGQTQEVTEERQSILDELLAMGVTEVKRRKRTAYRWYSRFFDGSDWLEDKKLTVFDRPPVVPVYANYKVFENKSIYHGAVEKLLDPQRVMNYSLSREIEEGALAPRAKWWMTQTQALGHESELATLNTNSDPVQFYNPDPDAPGAPLQSGGAQINPGLRTISESMRQIIGQTSGMFAANMGDNPGLQSGVAINALQNKGDNGTYKYFEALELAKAATGRVLIKAIPKVYNNARAMRLMYEDGTYEMADINQTVIDQDTGDVVVVNDLSQGVYDVVCQAGPAFQNRQQETLAALTEIAKIDPSIMQIGGDVMLNNINTPAAKTLAERKRAQMVQQGLIPPSQLTDEEKEELQQRQAAQGQQQDPGMVLAQAEMLKGQADMLKAQNEQAKIMLQQQTLQLEQQKFQASTQIEMAQAQAEVSKSATDQQLTTAKIKTEDAKVAIEAESLSLERSRLMLEEQRVLLEREKMEIERQIAVAELALKQEQERNSLERDKMQSLKQVQAIAKPQEVQQEVKPKRRRYNPKTDIVE
jgi:hypothetical protein